MKHEKLSDALNEIHDDFIAEATAERKRHPLRWASALAAVLAVAIAASAIAPRLAPRSEQAPAHENIQLSQALENQQEDLAEDNLPTFAPTETAAVAGKHRTFLLAAPEYPQMAYYPTTYEDSTYSKWRDDQRLLHDQPEGYADNLQSYFAGLLSALFSDSDQSNPVCSPVNIYMALAMVAETTGGESRQQILDLLRADSIESLRAQAGQIWKAHYNDDGLSTSILGSSLWLDEDVAYNEETVDTLAQSYYASVFRGALGTEEVNEALRSWLNEQTGDLLQEQAGDVKLAPNSVLAIATTVLYQVQWIDEFQEKFNTEATFHGTAGDSTQTFMNQTLSYGPYFWSDNFGAVYLSLEDGSRMWLILPDVGVKPDDILDEVSAFLAQDPAAYESAYENQKPIIVNLSLPKFDIACDMDLVDHLKDLGITDIFERGKADFSPILCEDDGGYVDQVKHATRVSIDEKGVTAAAFTVIDRCGAGMPPEDEIDFVLDRPFLFYIESSDGLPLFTGIVNEP